MATISRPLTYRAIARGAGVKSPDPFRHQSVAEGDPALRVMTDFDLITPFSISPTATLNDTNRKMIACQVRLLFVCDRSSTLLGLVTSTDILGEKPILYLNEHGGSRGEILAKDIMTPHADLEALDMRDVEDATVGDIVETMKIFGRQHILVVEPTADGGEVIRGLFSTSQIGRQLGRSIEALGRANTFAELEQAIAAG